MSRECGTCTKCCEGYLTGVVYDKPFYPGRPCHFVSIGKSCTIYAKRPKDPCVSYRCQWLDNFELPEWLKPNQSNVIITERTFEGTDIKYLDVMEAGDKLDSSVLSWIIVHALSKKLNLRWYVSGAAHYFGDSEFLKLMEGDKIK